MLLLRRLKHRPHYHRDVNRLTSLAWKVAVGAPAACSFASTPRGRRASVRVHPLSREPGLGADPARPAQAGVRGDLAGCSSGSRGRHRAGGPGRVRDPARGRGRPCVRPHRSARRTGGSAWGGVARWRQALRSRPASQRRYPRSRVARVLTGRAGTGARVLHQGAGRPVYVKPGTGSGASWGVTGSIVTESQLLRATLNACRYSDRVQVERAVDGEMYRLLFVDGELLDAIRRRLPTVIGDGRSTIRELVLRENERRTAARGRAGLWLLRIDLDSLFTLARAGLRLDSVPLPAPPSSSRARAARTASRTTRRSMTWLRRSSSRLHLVCVPSASAWPVSTS